MNGLPKRLVRTGSVWVLEDAEGNPVPLPSASLGGSGATEFVFTTADQRILSQISGYAYHSGISQLDLFVESPIEETVPSYEEKLRLLSLLGGVPE